MKAGLKSSFQTELTWRDDRPRIANTVLKENKVGGLTLPDVKNNHKAVVIKTVVLVKE